jgi:hypothetical protein
LVRATAPGPDGAALHLSDAELEGRSEAVYREGGRRLGSDGAWQSSTPEPSTGAVQSRFVVDILSGSSAGGINAIFLAKALASGQDVAHLRQMWIEEGDIDRLFNEERA